MNLENFTPFRPATFISAKEGTGFVTTVLVKAAFEMRHGKVAQPLEEQPFPAADIYPTGADPAASSLVYASDFVPYKPRAEVVVSATAYRPVDQPTGTFRVGIRVGELVKLLAVSGRREITGLLAGTIVEREPLNAIPITYENAFGGPKYVRNPVGRGHRSNQLPSVEYFDPRRQAPGDGEGPAGFGPIPPHWEPRKSLLGTVSPDYLDTHWPGLPADFDPHFFNAAPADQQFAGPVHGDEEIVLENLHPARPRFATRLPAWRVVCVREQEGGGAELIPLLIDTLWINPEANQLVLVWRGRTSSRTPDALEIRRLGFLVEPLTSALGDAALYQSRLQTLIRERDAEFEPQPIPAPESAAVATKADEQTAVGTDELQSMDAIVAEIRARAGLPPEGQSTEVWPRQPSPEARAIYDEILAGIAADELQQSAHESAEKWTRDKVVQAVQQRQSLAAADLSGLDLRDGDFAAADFREAKLDGANFSRARLTGALLTGCSLTRAIFDAAILDEASLMGANVQGGTFCGARLIAARLDGADLTGASLDGADLSMVTAEHAVLYGASLAGTILARANLTGAVLSRAKGAQADFRAAVLAGAACDHADFARANFQMAELRDADFTASKLQEADLSNVQALDADLTQAELRNSVWRGANCDGMWLSSAHADGADFTGASCVDLQCDGTSATQANFTGCRVTSFRGGQRADFTGATFRHAHGTEPVFESCRVDGANFSHANLPGANFIHASATRTNFNAAELNGARFDHANCHQATFLAANLFQAIFAGVNLIGADLGDGNFYGVEFLDARISKLRFQHCNLQRTKLEQWAATKQR